MKAERNLLDMRPSRLFAHELRDGDPLRVTVQVPRFRSRWMAWLQRRLRRPHVGLHLDPIGSSVWLQCDGQRSVAEIGRALQAQFGQQVEPIWDRLSLFLRALHQGRLIGLAPPQP
ncbi:MAG: PqqD family protein [Deltaproteobacteria bacterium]|nr:PqqD family protein [Deltaproteobacteria bacterium]